MHRRIARSCLYVVSAVALAFTLGCEEITDDDPTPSSCDGPTADTIKNRTIRFTHDKNPYSTDLNTTVNVKNVWYTFTSNGGSARNDRASGSFPIRIWGYWGNSCNSTIAVVLQSGAAELWRIEGSRYKYYGWSLQNSRRPRANPAPGQDIDTWPPTGQWDVSTADFSRDASGKQMQGNWVYD